MGVGRGREDREAGLDLRQGLGGVLGYEAGLEMVGDGMFVG